MFIFSFNATPTWPYVIAKFYDFRSFVLFYVFSIIKYCGTKPFLQKPAAN